MKQTTIKIFAVTGVLSLLGGAVTMAVAADLPASVKKLLSAAVKEGEATVFGTTMNPRQVKMMNNGFNKFYGTKIKLNQVGGRLPDLV